MKGRKKSLLYKFQNLLKYPIVVFFATNIDISGMYKITKDGKVIL